MYDFCMCDETISKYQYLWYKRKLQQHVYVVDYLAEIFKIKSNYS